MSHEALLEYGGTKADHCSIAVQHRPTPMRYVWHHVLPQACGGKTEAANLVQVCDGCHYSIHVLMWELANHQPVPNRCNRAQLGYAMTGYQEADAAGTANLIPKEA